MKEEDSKEIRNWSANSYNGQGYNIRMQQSRGRSKTKDSANEGDMIQRGNEHVLKTSFLFGIQVWW